jgi:hypothetical protein
MVVRGWMAALIEASMPVAEMGIEVSAMRQITSLLLFMN